MFKSDSRVQRFNQPQVKIMKSLPTTSASLRILALLGLLASTAQATLIYSENFTNAHVTPLNSYGWGVHVESTAKTNAGATPVSGWTMIAGGTGGGVSDIANINAGPNMIGADARTSLKNAIGSTAPAISWTSEYTVDTSANSINSISFLLGNSATSVTTRVAVRIGGNWYASVPTFTNATSGVYESKTLTWSTAASSWRSLTNDGDMTIDGSSVATTIAGTALSLGATLGANLPSGNITGFGLFFDGIVNNATARYDLYQIDATAIPEPSTYAALVGMVVLGSALIRRNRRS
jgi:hypothetical protein